MEHQRSIRAYTTPETSRRGEAKSHWCDRCGFYIGTTIVFSKGRVGKQGASVYSVNGTGDYHYRCRREIEESSMAVSNV